MISIHDRHSSDMEVEDIEKQMEAPESEGGMKVDELNININKKGGLVSGLLMKLLLKQMPVDEVKAKLTEMLGGADEVVKQKIMDKIDEILQMQTISMEHRMAGDPMLNGQMPEGFNKDPMPESGEGSQRRMVEPSVDQDGRPIDPAGALSY